MGCTVYRKLQRRKTVNTKTNFLHDTYKSKSNRNKFNVKVNHSLPTMSEKIDSDSCKTYAHATYSQLSQLSPSMSITKVLTSFIDDFKSLINQLISVLNQVISSLLSKQIINTSYTNNSLSFILFNANGLKKYIIELQSVLCEKRIALINETHFTKYCQISIPSYTVLEFNHPYGTAHNRVAIHIKTTLEFYSHSYFSQNYIQSCTISIK